MIDNTHNNNDQDDITKLTVPQVVLLTLLVTTITSVATAIVTVQLTSGVPGQTVFQTIEKVTETIVERPVDNQVDKVVVREGELVAQAVEANSNSSLEIFYGNETQEIIQLGYGFVVGNDTLITQNYEYPERMTTAGMQRISTHGADRLMLWRIIDEGETFESVEQVEFMQADMQVGETVVYIAGDGSIERGAVTQVASSSFAFSESLQGKDIGLMVNLDAQVLGVWTGDEIVRSGAVVTQIDQLAQNELHEIPGADFDPTAPVDTNPGDLSDAEKEQACEILGGEYNEYGECLGVDQAQCVSLGGEFNGCASACRHDENAQVCTQQCIVVCNL